MIGALESTAASHLYIDSESLIISVIFKHEHSAY